MLTNSRFRDPSILWYLTAFGVEIARPFLTLILPMVESIRAVENGDKNDKKQWLTYWILYSLLVLGESYVSRAIVWLPYYGVVRLAGIAWLVLPNTRGAQYVYDNIVLLSINKFEVFKSTKIVSKECLSLTKEEMEILSSIPKRDREKLMDAIKKDSAQAIEKLSLPIYSGEISEKITSPHYEEEDISTSLCDAEMDTSTFD